MTYDNYILKHSNRENLGDIVHEKRKENCEKRYND